MNHFENGYEQNLIKTSAILVWGQINALTINITGLVVHPFWAFTILVSVNLFKVDHGNHGRAPGRERERKRERDIYIYIIYTHV